MSSRVNISREVPEEPSSPKLAQRAGARAQQKEETRSRLLDAAEQLFAEHGVAGVRIHDITSAAGQRNGGAIHYHFGGKPELFRAVLARRLATINLRIHDLLDAVSEDGRQPEVREIITASVTPYVESLAQPWGCDFLRLFVHAIFDQGELVHEEVLGPSGDALERIRTLLRPKLANASEAILQERGIVSESMMLAALAHRANLMATDPIDPMPSEVFASNLIDEVVAVLTAPISSETRAAMRSPHP